LSWVGEIDGNMRPPKLTSSLALPRAPTAIGAACTVPKQVARCLAYEDTTISPPVVSPSSFITFGWSPCTVVPVR
jgi:hypothetical protein